MINAFLIFRHHLASKETSIEWGPCYLHDGLGRWITIGQNPGLSKYEFPAYGMDIWMGIVQRWRFRYRPSDFAMQFKLETVACFQQKLHLVHAGGGLQREGDVDIDDFPAATACRR